MMHQGKRTKNISYAQLILYKKANNKKVNHSSILHSLPKKKHHLKNKLKKTVIISKSCE